MSDTSRFLVLRLAWRNLWRHKRRSWLTIGAMAFCNTLLIYMTTLQFGTYDMMINNTVSGFSGYAQIQHQGYLDTPKMRLAVPEVQELAQAVRDARPASRASARASALVLLSSERRSLGVSVIGVQPETEAGVSSLPGLVREGRYLQGSDAPEIVIGSMMARNLKVSVGDELTLLGSGLDGSFAAGIVNVIGIFNTGIPELDRNVAEIPLNYFQETFSMERHGHGVVISVDSLEETESARASAEQAISNFPSGTGSSDKYAELVAMDWDTINPGVMQSIQSDLGSAWFIYFILIILVAFSVLNTQLMSVMERTREFGVILSLGVKPVKLARLVVLETGLIALIGLVLGLIAGGALALYFNRYGLWFEGLEEFAAMYNITDRIYPKISVLTMSLGPVIVSIFCLIASFYPAMRLFRLEPIEAMRTG